MAKPAGIHKQSKGKHKKKTERVKQPAVSRTELIMLSNDETPKISHHSGRRVPSMFVLLNTLLILVFLSLAITFFLHLEAFSPGHHDRAAKITTRYSYVREGNGIEFPVVARIHQNTEVKCIEERGDWIKVRLQDGQTGWVHSQDVAR